jgi:3-oxoacyl-[acyl-carrier protein] reductase
LALVRDFLQVGARVCALDLDAVSLAALPPQESLLALVCNVTDQVAVETAVETCVTAFGCPSVLVNNAGLARNGPLYNFLSRETNEQVTAAWKEVLDVNLNGAFIMARAVVKRMLRSRVKGVIVNISSVCAAGNPGQGAYSASKAGLEAATVAWAAELGPMGVRVAAVAPGYASTETTVHAVAPAMLESIIKRTPLKRLAAPEEIVTAVRFVVASDFFNGRVLAVDGGLRV